MAEGISTISLPKKVKRKAIEASKEMFGTDKGNLSGYIQVLINEDCKKRNIKSDE